MNDRQCPKISPNLRSLDIKPLLGVNTSKPTLGVGLIEALTDAYESEMYVLVDDRYIPPATLERLIVPEAPGDRHNAAKSIVASLACQRLKPRSIYRLLAAAYPARDFREDIDGLVNWVCDHGSLGEPCKLPSRALNDVEAVVEISTKDFPELAMLEHSGTLRGGRNDRFGRNGLAALKKSASPAAAKQAVLDLCGGTLPAIGPKDFIVNSPIPLVADWHERLAQFLAALYPVGSPVRSVQETSPLINIVFRTFPTKDEKFAPFGGGLTFSARRWSQSVGSNIWMPCFRAEQGVFYRINPVMGKEGAGTGSGKKGSYTDEDIEVRRRMYVLVESDDLPLKEQLALWWQHRECVAALTSSGGKSGHALLVVLGVDLAFYQQAARALTNHFRPLGFDATDNASRLSRLPGVARTSKADRNDPYGLAGRQELLWLNPDATFAHKLLKNQKNEPEKARTPAGA